MDPRPRSDRFTPNGLRSARATVLRIAASALIACLACAPAIAGADDGERAPKPATCVKVHTEARYVPYGYDHIVELENTCDKAMVCDVSTDVNPTPTTVELAAGETKSTLTYRGSPASEFKAQVDCKEQ